MTDLDPLVRATVRDFSNTSDWNTPVEFPNSLALCALNSAYSLRGNSTAAANVLTRYRALRPTADADSGPDLIAAMDNAGGPVGFARDILRNDSKLPGTKRVRPEGIYEGLTRLSALDTPVTTTKELRLAVANDSTSAKRAWLSVKGFGALAWSFLIMNAGVGTEIKPDVMIRRYLARVLGPDDELNASRMRQVIELAAAELKVEPRTLDRAIWLHESPSSPVSRGR